MRLNFHYLYALIILTVYGGQVCPFVESLNIFNWGLEVALILFFSYILRALSVSKILKSFPLAKQVRSQLISDFIIFAGTGLFAGVFNTFVYSFPLESGLKLILGWLTFAFFIAVDMALERERDIAGIVNSRQEYLNPKENYAPITRKFIFVGIMSIMLTTMILFLVVAKDLDWLINSAGADKKKAMIIILGEILFISFVMLSLLVNVILSFSKNIKLFFRAENNVLAEVLSGNYLVSVPVSTNDEFGVLAYQTNSTIENLKRRTEEIVSTQNITIVALASLAETRDNETGLHIMRTQLYVKALAIKLKQDGHFSDILNDKTIDLLYKSAPLHDIGKVGIPDNILLKPAKLTDEEFMIMKRHPYIGYMALKKAADDSCLSSFLNYAMEISLTHHEKWDGTGYPNGLKGEEIPLSGRLMALADVYDALISKRVYKPAFPHEKAVSIIKDGRGTHFDPVVVDAFCNILEIFENIAVEHKD